MTRKTSLIFVALLIALLSVTSAGAETNYAFTSEDYLIAPYSTIIIKHGINAQPRHVTVWCVTDLIEGVRKSEVQIKRLEAKAGIESNVIGTPCEYTRFANMYVTSVDYNHITIYNGGTSLIFIRVEID